MIRLDCHPPKVGSGVGKSGVSAWTLYQAQCARLRHRLGAVLDVQFAVHGVEMGFDSAFGDIQLAGDVAVRQAFGHQREHIKLTLAERFNEWLRMGRR
jgi:hypothetical protein